MLDTAIIPPKSWALPCLVVRASGIQGLGVFTLEDIAVGTTVIVWGGLVFTIDDFRQGKAKPHTNVGIDEGLFLAEPAENDMTLDDYMNHSCDPNLWLKDAITLETRREIFAGEELTIDYAMELTDEDYVMKQPCRCGSAICRQIVTGKDWQLEQLQQAYGNHFSPFILRRIARMKSVGIR